MASDVIVVLGVHRSGTSALTGLLRLLGVHLGSRLLGGGPTNQKGHWENARITSSQQGLLLALGTNWGRPEPLPEGWECSDPGKRFEAEIRDIIRDEFDGHALWGFKDPRTCQLVPFWQRLLTELGRRPHYVITFRHPMDVAASLAKRDGMGLQQALDLWYQRVTQALSDTSALERVVVSYDMLLANWRGVAEGIGAKLCVKWPHAPQEIAVQAAEFIDANLHHHRDGARSQLPRHLEAVYEELKGLETWAQ